LTGALRIANTCTLAQISGAENAEFVKFSGQALNAAQQRLVAFLAVMPAEDFEAAKQAVAAESASMEDTE
jgi:hypothetical protein